MVEIFWSTALGVFLHKKQSFIVVVPYLKMLPENVFPRKG